MTASTRETVLSALFSCLGKITGATVLRNEVFPEEIPSGGLIILRDGDIGEPEVFLSPLTYLWTHNAVLEVAVQKSSAASRDTALDVLFQSISTALSDSGKLGGVCDSVMPLAPNSETLQVEGASNIKAATVSVELVYETASQLG